MGKPKGGDGYEKWVRIANKNNGYLGLTNWESAEDKAIVELGIVQDWRKSMFEQMGLEIGTPQSSPTDPPDCFVQFGGRRLGVELMLMVERAHLVRAAQGESPHAGRLFNDMQWTSDRFLAKLNECLDAKHQKYSSRGVQIDVLVIFSPEKWLVPCDVRRWLKDTLIECRGSISSSFLLLDYEPEVDGLGRYPLYSLYDSIFDPSD
ncbi:MAG: hypothetical protein JNK34_07225 [Tabrizicola sp.]|nr:hypothetical protein [Tabrizicola sp.]